MAEIHTVTKGESLSRIAKQYDIASAKVLYNHEANESLRQLRPNIDQIQPGDQVNIPDKK